MQLGVTQDVLVNIENRLQLVTVVVEYYIGARTPEYWVSAITETGFDLCNHSYGYFKGNVARNTRLRSEKSIVIEMIDVLDVFVNAIENLASEILLTSKQTVVKIEGTDVYSSINGARFFNAACIRSKQSGQVISWYEHNVFTQGQLEIEVTRNKDGQLQFSADENKLYDLIKLRELHDSKDFQNSKYAFMFYNEVRRLLGIPVKGHPERMSGLMPSDVQE